jgi:trehalose synthase
MAKIPELETFITLDDYAAVSYLSAGVAALRAVAKELVPLLGERTVWMINSTAEGGGVAELLPGQISLLRELGVDVRWAVIETDREEFFSFTKRLHNLIHGEDVEYPTEGDRALYEDVSRENAEALRQHIQPNDIIIVHDPQPLAAGLLLANELGTPSIWRCHIGLDEQSEHAAAAWSFLQPYAQPYNEVVFSLPEYVPAYLQDCATIIHPTIDPLSHKNRDLSLHKLVGILSDSGLAVPHWPLLDPPFPDPACRMQADGSFVPATQPDDIGLLARPIVTQVSRWDRLKGFAPLIDAFALLKRERTRWPIIDQRHERRIDAVRLVLAGPEPAAIQDDPEALQVLHELKEQILALEPELQQSIALIALPMSSRKQNAVMVNALQRSSDIVVQNSLREGFGLTVAEAMWKGIPILGSARAAGVRLQVRDGEHGRMTPDPEDPEAIAAILHDMLGDFDRLDEWGRNAQRRIHEEFLVFTELIQWLRLLAGVVSGAGKRLDVAQTPP